MKEKVDVFFQEMKKSVLDNNEDEFLRILESRKKFIEKYKGEEKEMLLKYIKERDSEIEGVIENQKETLRKEINDTVIHKARRDRYKLYEGD